MPAPKGQFDGFTGAPDDALAQLSAILGGMPGGGGTTTQSKSPGLFDFASLFLAA